MSTLGQNIELALELCDGVTMDTLHTDQNYTSDDTKKCVFSFIPSYSIYCLHCGKRAGTLLFRG